MIFEIFFLGTNSAIPIGDRRPSAQVVNINHEYILIDCGEGTQMQISKYGLKHSKIKHICLSHLHGDHSYGIFGLLTTMSLMKRVEPVFIHGPKNTNALIQSVLKFSGAFLSFPLHIKEYDPKHVLPIIDESDYSIACFPLKHRIETIGFKIENKPSNNNIYPDAIEKYGLNIEDIKALKKGEKIIKDGYSVAPGDVLFSKFDKRSYAYCSDTIYDTKVPDYIRPVDVLYHETTYLQMHQELAKERYHSTLDEAIDIAKRSKAKVLIGGHYSSRYHNIDEFQVLGSVKFKSFIAAVEGLNLNLYDSSLNS